MREQDDRQHLLRPRFDLLPARNSREHGTEMRVLVCGSRHWQDRDPIIDRLADLPGTSTIVVGYDPEHDRPQGVDRIAYQEAQKLGLLVEPHPALWEKYGKSAGFRRNTEMVDLGADLCIAFWDGKSNGTKDTMTKAEEVNIPVEIVWKEGYTP